MNTHCQTFGASVAISEEYAIVGDYLSDQVYVFTKSRSRSNNNDDDYYYEWIEYQTLQPNDNCVI